MIKFTVRYLEDSIIIEDQESNIRELPDGIDDDQRYQSVISYLSSIGYTDIQVVDQYDNVLELEATPVVIRDIPLKSNKYEVISYINDLGDKITAIELKEEYVGWIISFEDIELPPVYSDDDDRVINYKYNVHYRPADSVFDVKKFERYIEVILCDILENGLKCNVLEYV
jgi:hypothetical protein